MLIVILLAVLLPEPETLVVANLRAETIDVTVAGSDKAEFHLTAAWRDSRCLRNVIIRPREGAVVTYSRRIEGPLAVSVRGGASYTADAGIKRVGSHTQQFLVDTNSSCRSKAAVRLPIMGELSVGSDGIGGQGEDAMPLLSGTLNVYARSTDTFGPIQLGAFSEMIGSKRRAFFHAETVDLPAGSRIGRTHTQNANNFAPWRGFADINLADPSERGMVIDVSTNASALDLLSPLPPALRDSTIKGSDGPPVFDVVSLRAGARLFGDPSLRFIFVFSSILLTLLGLALQLFLQSPRYAEAPRRLDAMKLTFSIIFILVLTITMASADVVFVGAGNSEQGQGWRFPDAGACWVATALHVVANDLQVKVTSSDGMQVDAQVVARRAIPRDLALLSIPGPCPQASLGDRDEGSLLSSLVKDNHASIRLEHIDVLPAGRGNDASSIISTPVIVIGLDNLTPVFTIRPQVPHTDQFYASYSGGAVILHSDEVGASALPIGLVLEAKSYIARVVRMDEIPPMLAEAEAKIADGKSIMGLGETSIRFWGRSIEPSCMPEAVIAAKPSCAWQLIPDEHKRMLVELDFGEQARSISEIDVLFTSGNARAIDVRTSDQRFPSEDEWGPARYCAFRAGTHFVNCTLAPRLARAVRISFVASRAGISEMRVR